MHGRRIGRRDGERESTKLKGMEIAEREKERGSLGSKLKLLYYNNFTKCS